MPDSEYLRESTVLEVCHATREFQPRHKLHAHSTTRQSVDLLLHTWTISKKLGGHPGPRWWYCRRFGMADETQVVIFVLSHGMWTRWAQKPPNHAWQTAQASTFLPSY